MQRYLSVHIQYSLWNAITVLRLQYRFVIPKKIVSVNPETILRLTRNIRFIAQPNCLALHPCCLQNIIFEQVRKLVWLSLVSLLMIPSRGNVLIEIENTAFKREYVCTPNLDSFMYFSDQYTFTTLFRNGNYWVYRNALMITHKN